jgi:hypothetical protein
MKENLGQSKKEMLQQKIVEMVKEFVAQEGGISFIDLENLFGRDSKFMAALTKNLMVSF